MEPRRRDRVCGRCRPRSVKRVSADGGVADAMLADGIERRALLASVFSPHGRHFVYFGRPQKHGIYVATLDSPGATLLLTDYVAVAYSPPGYLLALIGPAKGAPAGTLMAYQFEPTRFELVGGPVPLAEQVATTTASRAGISRYRRTGRLCLEIASGERRSWSGSIEPGKRSRRSAASITISRRSRPTRRPVLPRISTPQTRRGPLAHYNPQCRVGYTSFGNLNFMPVWSPDGTSIVFAGTRGSPPNLIRKSAAAASGEEELLVKSSFNNQPSDWSPDGKFIVYGNLQPKTQWDVWLLPTSSAPSERRPVPFLQTVYNEHLARFSPDGRWLAYVSDESGTNEVYVVAFPIAGTKLRVSTHGGSDPRWRGDGRELFYYAGDRRLMTAGVTLGATLEINAPEPLFAGSSGSTDMARNFGYETSYDVTRDGQRFLVSTTTEESTPTAKIVLNWPAALRR